MSAETPEHIDIPENFRSTLADFVRDLSNTFPEYKMIWDDLTTKMETNYELATIFSHCLGVYPERFFDILYQNEDIFKADSGINTMFLPGVEFKALYSCEGVTENTKKSMWKYIQLILFSLIGCIKDKSDFGDTMNMFDGIDEGDLQSKMKETLDSIGDFFNNLGDDMDPEAAAAKDSEDAADEPPEEFTFDKTTGMPDLNGIHEHLKGLFDGKIGSLAKNIAEEISGEFEQILGEDYKDVRSTKDVFQKMMKNPQKMMELIKKVGDKIKSRMDNGEISKDDIMAEAGDILRKMREMGGGSDEKLQEMLRNMAKGMGMGKNTRVDMNAVNRMTKQQTMRERIKKKVDARREAAKTNANFVLEQTGQSNYVFKMPEEGEQPRSSLPPPKYTDEELIAELSGSVAAPAATAAPSSSQKNKKNKKSKGKK